MNLLQRLKLRWALRGSTANPLAPVANREQVHQDTAEEAFRKTHGYSMARLPLPATADISKHNAEVQKEYDAEVERRKTAYYANPQTYRPRYFNGDPMYNIVLDAYQGVPNWDLEMTLRRGARVDVTAGIGVDVQPSLSPQEFTEARLAGNLGAEVALLEDGIKRPVKTPRQFVGTRAQMLLACNGDETLCDQLEAKVCATFGVTSLDDAIPS